MRKSNAELFQAAFVLMAQASSTGPGSKPLPSPPPPSVLALALIPVSRFLFRGLKTLMNDLTFRLHK